MCHEDHPGHVGVIAQIASTTDYGFGEFSVALGHAYHHLNTAWNSQNAAPASVEEFSEGDVYRRQFPEYIYLGPTSRHACVERLDQPRVRPRKRNFHFAGILGIHQQR